MENKTHVISDYNDVGQFSRFGWKIEKQNFQPLTSESNTNIVKVSEDKAINKKGDRYVKEVFTNKELILDGTTLGNEVRIIVLDDSQRRLYTLAKNKATSVTGLIEIKKEGSDCQKRFEDPKAELRVVHKVPNHPPSVVYTLERRCECPEKVYNWKIASDENQQRKVTCSRKSSDRAKDKSVEDDKISLEKEEEITRKAQDERKRRLIDEFYSPKIAAERRKSKERGKLKSSEPASPPINYLTISDRNRRSKTSSKSKSSVTFADNAQVVGSTGMSTAVNDPAPIDTTTPDRQSSDPDQQHDTRNQNVSAATVRGSDRGRPSKRSTSSLKSARLRLWRNPTP